MARIAQQPLMRINRRGIDMAISGNKNRGFTLLELMIVVIVVAILAALAMYNYAKYGFRSRRVDGQSLLMNIAAAEQRFYTNYNNYASSITSAPPTGLGLTSATSPPPGYYTATIAVAANGQSYTLTAAPVSGLAQEKDQCKKLTLTDTGVKNMTGDTSNGSCW
ncbi:MAG TPA: type IV pilin protein [Rudaea sp.]|nr:type IV pilin protein [Rudaea sp.]